MARPFNELRMLMHEYGYTQKEIGDVIGVTTCSVSRRMNAQLPWTSDEMWKIMELFHIPAKRMHEVFPKQGINEPGVQRPVYRKKGAIT